MSLKKASQELGPKLTSAAKITFPDDPHYADVVARWSNYKAPQPGIVITVASESDIEHTVQWAVSHKLKFLAQGGGHGFAQFEIGPSDALINLRGLRKTTVDAEKGTAIIEAGALTGEVIMEAHKAQTHIVVGNCNSTGAIGPILGGGMSRLQGNYGFGIDNMLEARLVTARGKAITVSSSENADLWWGLRGAGHNFGIVSSIKMKAHPQINRGEHWIHFLPFSQEQIEVATEVLSALHFKAGLSAHFLFGCFPPEFKPSVAFSLWAASAPSEARTSFAPLLDLLSPAASTVPDHTTPYSLINADGDAFSGKTGRKRFWACGLSTPHPRAMREGWDLYSKFIEDNGDAMKQSFWAVESYSHDKVREVQEGETAFPWRGVVSFWVILNIVYDDPALDEQAETFGEKFRATMRKYSNAPDGPHPMYVNFAHGDETSEEMYGDANRLAKLRALKSKWDPEGYFNSFNPIV